eukprot:CAMPEP_0119033972 /NCGR_PEP_ID=MMETSP1177-20130426/1040_1 /TAXON_ID=2985 /ORGANISM="Ochromonas sp, Strain CCMP1899" /LENGTH=226 /DNA_ID=CAMNT_0006991129 /DNA_START=339 /DNA_END=1019 /DNA_ORIENTATION=+
MCKTNQQSEQCKRIKFGSTFAATFFLLGGLHIESNQHWDTVLLPPQANARNLPISNGASGLNRGKAVSLVPILKLRNMVNSVLLQLPNIQNCKDLLSKVPNNEKDFKILFDEHSEGISYKQTFLDQNAFLVYYTKGFDGPGRPSIEDEDSNSIKEKGQYGARNDAWVNVDEARAEISYLLEFKSEKINVKDLKKALLSASKAFTDYVSYDTESTVKEAEDIIMNSK